MSGAHYLIQINIYLALFYGFYRLLLYKETYFTLNRFYLVFSGVLSLAIPFIRLEWLIRQQISQNVSVSVGQLNDYMLQMTIMPEKNSAFSVGSMLACLYVAGVLFYLIRFIVQLFAVLNLLRIKTKGVAFSFFNKKVIDNTLPDFSTINSHEELHVRQYHSADILFFELLGVINWFNPVVYYYKQSIRNIHEYLADEEAARVQGDKKEYALLLLSKAFNVTRSNLTNGFFNRSLIKKRIYMLHKQRSKKTAVLHYGLFLPLFAITLVMSSSTIKNNENMERLANQIPLDEPLTVIKETVGSVTGPTETGSAKLHEPKNVKGKGEAFIVEKDGEKVRVKHHLPFLFQDDQVFDFTNLDQQPTFPGGMNNFYQFLKHEVRYPELAVKQNKMGKVFLSFVIEKNGTLSDIEVERKVGFGLDEEAIRVMKKSPKWIPGVQAGRKVRVKYNIPISFTLSK